MELMVNSDGSLTIPADIVQGILRLNPGDKVTIDDAMYGLRIMPVPSICDLCGLSRPTEVASNGKHLCDDCLATIEELIAARRERMLGSLPPQT